MKPGQKEQTIKLELNKLVLEAGDIVVVRVPHHSAIRPVTDLLLRRKIFPKGHKIMVVPPGITFQNLGNFLTTEDLNMLLAAKEKKTLERPAAPMQTAMVKRQ